MRQRGREGEGQSPTIMSMLWGGLHSDGCERGGGVRGDTLDDAGDGEASNTLAEGIRGELALLAHEEECEAGDVGTIHEILVNIQTRPSKT